MERLDKFLCDSGAGTRSQVKVLLKQGRVTVDGNVEKDNGRKIDPKTNIVTLDGEVLGGSIMRATPAAVEEYSNVSTQHYVDTYCQCCVNVGVQNTSGIPILVDNPNITVVRVCG